MITSVATPVGYETIGSLLARLNGIKRTEIHLTTGQAFQERRTSVPKMPDAT